MKVNETKIKYVRYAAMAILVASLVAIALLLLNHWDKQQGVFPTKDDEDIHLDTTTVYNGKEYTLRDNLDTVLIMGLDKFSESVTTDSYINDQQSDFMMLLVINKDTRTASAIHINRDTMAEMDILGVGGQKVGKITAQLALSHTYGSGSNDSCRNTVRAVSKFLGGVPIEHYISVTMDAVSIVNDMVGGVEVEVLHDFEGSDTFVKGETVTLLGEDALYYVRGRKDVADQSNLMRMVRQRQYLGALQEKVMQFMQNTEEFSAELLIKLADHMVTDYAADVLDDLLQRLSEYGEIIMRDIEGENKMGEKHIEFYADKASIKRTVIDLFYEESK